MMRLASAGIFKNKIEPQYNCSIWTTLNVRGILLHSGNVFFRFCCESKLLSLTKEQAPNFAEPPFKSSERCLTHKITIFSVLLKSTGLEKTESGKLKRTQRENIYFMCTREQNRVPPAAIYKNTPFLCVSHVGCVESLLSVKGPFPIKRFSLWHSPGPSPLLQAESLSRWLMSDWAPRVHGLETSYQERRKRQKKT